VTVGSIVQDETYPFSTDCGTAIVGSYFQKVWSGEDSPAGSRDRSTPHNYHLEISKQNHPLISYTIKNNPVPYTGTLGACFGMPGFTDLDWDSNDDLKLLDKLSTKIRKNDFNGDAFLAEGHQTLSLLASTATRLAGFLEAVRHGNVYKAAKYLGGPRRSSGKSKIINTLKRELTPNGQSTGSLANAILEVQYGWRPLLKDAHEFGTALAAIYHKIPHESYKVMRKKVDVQEQDTGNVVFLVKTTKVVRLKVTIASEPSARDILHMNDPLAAAYELTPWSFIGDWFLPIGTWLSDVNLANELGITSVLRSTKITRDAIYKGTSNSDLTISNTGGFFVSEVIFDRNVEQLENWTAVPLPSFKKVSKVFSPEHVLNAFALLHSTSNRFNSSLKF